MVSLRRHASAGLGVVLSRLEDAIIEFCRREQPEDLQNVLIAVGHAEHWLSKSSLSRDSDRNAGLRPLNSLSQSWVRHANDGASAFRLARAMASILGESEHEEKKVRIGTVRENMFPVDADSPDRLEKGQQLLRLDGWRPSRQHAGRGCSGVALKAACTIGVTRHFPRPIPLP